MHLKSALGVILLLLSSLGHANVGLVKTSCRDTGQRGLALSLQLACYAAECHVGPQTEQTCADEDCCEFDELPLRAFGPQSADATVGRIASVDHALLPVDTRAPGTGGLDHLPSRSGHPPGSDCGAFAGFPRPLLI